MALMSSSSLRGKEPLKVPKDRQLSPTTLAAAKYGMVAEADLTLLEGEWVSGSRSEGLALVGGGAATSSYLDVEGR